MSRAALASPVERFAESLAVVPLVHTPVRSGNKCLSVGSAAGPLVEVAARYPDFGDLVGMGTVLKTRDKRYRSIQALTALPEDWKADVAAVAVVGPSEGLLADVKARCSPSAVVVVASDRFAAGNALRTICRNHWTSVVMYRDFLPEPSVFALCGNSSGLNRSRPVPGWCSHLSESYLPNLFRLAKDEYQFLYDGGS